MSPAEMARIFAAFVPVLEHPPAGQPPQFAQGARQRRGDDGAFDMAAALAVE